MAYTPQFEKEYENGWVDFPSEETLVTAHALDMYDETFEHIEEYLEDNPIIQTTTMPTASEDELGHIYQYMGETTATFTQGYFYKCVSDEEEEPTYSWQNISVQSGGSALSDLTDVNIVSPIDGEGLIYNGSNQKWKNGNAPSALTNDYWNNSTTYAVGDIVIYLNGLYRCKVANTGQTPTDTTYWKSISLADISKNICKTGERVIGEWIDGRPIYENVIVLQTPLQCNTNVWTYVQGSGLGDGVSPFIIDARVIDGNGTYFGYIGCNYSGGLFGILNIRTNNNINVSRLILQYTKSTD